MAIGKVERVLTGMMVRLSGIHFPSHARIVAIVVRTICRAVVYWLVIEDIRFTPGIRKYILGEKPENTTESQQV